MNKIIKSMFSTVLIIGISLITSNSLRANMVEASADNTTVGTEERKENMSDNNLDNAWKNTKEAGSDLWKATKHGASDAGDAISETSSEAWEATKDASGKAWEATKKGASDAGDAISEKSSEAWDATKEGAAKAKDAISEEFE